MSLYDVELRYLAETGIRMAEDYDSLMEKYLISSGLTKEDYEEIRTRLTLLAGRMAGVFMTMKYYLGSEDISIVKEMRE